MIRTTLRRFSVYCLVVAPLLVTQGCMLATQQDILKLDDDLNQMRKNQADLITKMTDLGGNLESLNSQLESNQQRMTALSQKLDDVQADITRRLSVLTGQVTGTTSAGSSNPGDVYRLAYNDYQAGKFDLAVVGFRNFMSQFPKSELAPQAQFQIGECEFGRKNYMDATREYDKVGMFFPKSDVVPKALYKMGVAYQQANRRADALAVFRRLVKEYPHNDLSKSAKEILKEAQ